MFGTRIRKIFSDIGSHKMRTLLVSISIFIGVFGTVTMFSMGDLLVRQLEKDLDKSKLSMVRINLTPNAEVDNDELLATLRSQPGLMAAEGQAVYPFTWKKNTDQDFQTSMIFAYSEPLDSIQIEPILLEKGAYPQEGRNELVVERRFAEKFDLAIGDTIRVQVLGQTEGISEETWTLVGIVFFPYGYPGLNDVLPANSVFAHYADAQHITGFTGFSSIYVRYKDFRTAQQQADHLTDVIAAEGSYIPILTYTENPDDHSRIRFAASIGGVMAGLAMLALFASGFLVLNVIISIIIEQKNQIGTLKTLGASRLDIIFIYAGIALVYGILGVIPGVILGIPMGFFAAQGLAPTANSFIDEYGYSMRAILLGIGMGLLVPVLASIIPVLNSTRIRIIQATTDLGISSRYGQGLLAKIVQYLPLPITVRQGISNVLRKRGRMTLTGIALTIAAGAFMGVFASFTAIDSLLATIFGSYNYQFTITPHESSDLGKTQTLLADHFSSLTVRGVSVDLAIEIDGFDKEFDPATGPPALFASGFDPAFQPYSLKLDAGRDLSETPDGILISRSIADYLDKQVGDTLTIHAGGHQGDYTITGIAAFPFDSVWFDWRTLAALANLTDQNGNPAPTGLLVEMNTSDPSASDVSDKIDEINQVLMANGMTASYGNMVLLNESISQALSMFQVIFNFAALLIALVGAIGLLTTLSMSVFERQKEIGVMRSIGADSITIMTQFLSEGISVGIFAWLVGVPLSLVVYSGMITAMNMGDEYQGQYSLQAAVIGLVGIVFITTVASILPSMAAARKTVSDILRYQ